MDKTVELAYDEFEDSETKPELSPLILLHGLFWNKFDFKELAWDLCKATRRKVFTVDLRCHGQSPFREECTAELMAEDMKRFLDDRRLKRVNFVTHSYSCTTAYLVTVDRPDNVEKLLLIDNPPYFEFNEQTTKTTVTPQVLAQNRLLTRLDPNMTLQDARAKLLKLAEVGDKSQEIFYKKLVHDLIKEDNQFKWKVNLDFLLEKYKQGALTPVCRGTSDKDILIVRCPNSLRSYDAKVEIARKYNPNLKLITMEGTTHLLMFEKQKEFVAIAKNFLKEK